MDKKNRLQGALLHATEQLAGSFFEDAVILVAVHDENGAFGLMINRPSHMPLHEVFNPVPAVGPVSHPFYIGGPVDEEGLHLIHLTDPFNERNGLEVFSGVELGGEWDTIDDILLSDPEKTFLFLGYSGWNSGQLEEEIAEGSWVVHNADVLELLKTWSTRGRFSRAELEELLNYHKIG